MIVWLASYPRSGNTLVRMLLTRGFGIVCNSIYPEPEDAGPHNPFADPRIKTWSETNDLDAMRRDRAVHFLKTHGLPCDGEPAVCVVRDGRDAAVSYARFLMHYEPAAVAGLTFEQVLDELALGRLGFGCWTQHVQAWRDRTGPTAWLRYEDLLERPYERLLAALRSVGVDVAGPASPPPTFAELHARWPDFFRQGKAGAWKREMPPRCAELFHSRHSHTLRALGYEAPAEE